MKRLITILLIVSCLFVPSFVYAEGGKEMAYKSTYKVPTVQDMINEATGKKSTGIVPTATAPKKTTTPTISNTPKNTVNSSYTYEDYLNAHKNEPRGGSMKDSDLVPQSWYNPTNGNTYHYDGTGEIEGIDYRVDYAALLAQQQAQYEAQLKALKEAQIQSRINALDSQRSGALSSLDSEKATISPMYYDKRNQAAAASDKGALNFAQFMASRGVQGNAGAMPEIYRNAALQGQIGALNQQEASDLSNIEARRSQINSAYERDVAAARAEAESQALQNTLNMQMQAQKDALEQARYDTQMKTQADVTAYNRLQDTKNEYANTVSRFGDNYQAEYDKVANDGDPSNDWQLAILAAARQKKIDEANKKYQQQGYVSEDIAAALNLPVGTMTEAYKKQQQEAAAKQQVDNAMKMFAQLGYLTPEMVQILSAYGLSQDDITRMYRNQSTGGSSGGSGIPGVPSQFTN
jgi:hypothetical protein